MLDTTSASLGEAEGPVPRVFRREAPPLSRAQTMLKLGSGGNRRLLKNGAGGYTHVALNADVMEDDALTARGFPRGRSEPF